MEPAFFRGDILFLYMGKDKFRVGEIIVFTVNNRPIPIVHRVLEVHDRPNGDQDILTKGDNNEVDDRGLYDQKSKQLWLKKSDVMGRAKAFLPQVGMVTIWLTEYPMLKYLVIGLMGLAVLTTKE
jgi:signal peptidase